MGVNHAPSIIKGHSLNAAFVGKIRAKLPIGPPELRRRKVSHACTDTSTDVN